MVKILAVEQSEIRYARNDVTATPRKKLKTATDRVLFEFSGTVARIARVEAD